MILKTNQKGITLMLDLNLSFKLKHNKFGKATQSNVKSILFQYASSINYLEL